MEEYNWEFWKFERTQRGAWNKVENQRLFFESLAKKIGNLSFYFSN